jgi:hypothetical protein
MRNALRDVFYYRHKNRKPCCECEWLWTEAARALKLVPKNAFCTTHVYHFRRSAEMEKEKLNGVLTCQYEQ